MGLIKLALLGGAGYYAIKKINENKNNNNTNPNNPYGRCGRRNQNQKQYDRNAPVEPYYDEPTPRDQGYPNEKQQSQQQGPPYYVQGRDMSSYFNIRPEHQQREEVVEKQRYYDFEPDYTNEKRRSIPIVEERRIEGPASPQFQQGQQQQQMAEFPREKREYQKNF